MFYATDNPDLVIRIADLTSIPRGHRLWDEEVQPWLDEGNTPLPRPNPDATA